MEYFDSCATKIMMRGPIVYQLCLGRNEKQTFYALYSLQIIPRSQCGMGLLSSGMLSLTQLRFVSPSWQKVQ